MSQGSDLPKGFSGKVRIDLGQDAPTKCWLWQGALVTAGYGAVRRGGQVKLAHRVMWEENFGEIPIDMTVDHICHQRNCVNPTHLRLLSNEENASLNAQGIATHCKRGHEFDEANTYVGRDGRRRCRACRRHSRHPK